MGSGGHSNALGTQEHQKAQSAAPPALPGTASIATLTGWHQSRFLLVAPFSYNGKSPVHWYAWDIDACWILNVAGAGVFGSAQDALAEWQHAVGPAAGTALSPCMPETTARLLAHSLKTGPLSDMLEGSEPRELIREYYRLRRRASGKEMIRPPSETRRRSAAKSEGQVTP